MPFRFRHFALLLIVPAVSVRCVSAQQCTRNCSTALRHSLNAILGISTHHHPPVPSAPLFLLALSPLDTLIRASPNNVVVQRKTEWICNSVDKFKQCTDNCEENRLKLVEMANVDHWAVVCRTLFAHPKIFSEFIGCQRKLLADVGQRCRAPNATTEKGEGPKMLAHFCKQMNVYAKCYRRTTTKCTKNATMISHQLSEAIGRSFARIHQIARGHLQIPAQCHRSVDILVAPEEQRGKKGGGDENNERQYPTEDGGSDDYWQDGEKNGEFWGRRTAAKKVAVEKNGAGRAHPWSISHFIFYGFS